MADPKHAAPKGAHAKATQAEQPTPEQVSQQSIVRQYVRNPRRLAIGGGIVLAFVLFIFLIATFAQPAQSSFELLEEVEALEEAESASQPVDSSKKMYGDGSLEGVDDLCVDQFDTPTVHAILELKGSVLETLLSSKSWQYRASSASWADKTNGAVLCVLGQNGWMTDDQIAELETGATSPALYTISVSTSRYASAEDAFSALSQATVIEWEWAGDTALALCADSQGNEVIVMVSSAANSYTITVAGDPALAAGLFDYAAGGSYGRTPRDVFWQISGRTIAEEVESSDAAH